MRKILFILFIFLFVFFIYFFTQDTKEYIVLMGDDLCDNKTLDKVILRNRDKKLEKYVNACQKNETILDLLNRINNNEVIKYKNNQYTSKNLLIKADTIIISIGKNDLLNYKCQINKYMYFDEVLLNIEKLLKLVRYYSKEKIYIYNYNHFDKRYLTYINNRLVEIAKQNNASIIDINSIKTIDNMSIINKTINTIYK